MSMNAAVALKENTAVAGEADGSVLKAHYLETLTFVERLHRCLLDVIKDELDRIGCDEINSVQALLLFNIGDAELTAGELRTRGHYLGSNVSYNLKKLVDTNYIHHKRSEADRRSVRVSLTEKGHEIKELVDELYERHLLSLTPVGEVGKNDLETVNTALRRLERFWTDQIRYRL